MMCASRPLPSGSRFRVGLIDQGLRSVPPSRLLAPSSLEPFRIPSPFREVPRIDQRFRDQKESEMEKLQKKQASKSIKTLKLHKETLVDLDESKMHFVVGGEGSRGVGTFSCCQWH